MDPSGEAPSDGEIIATIEAIHLSEPDINCERLLSRLQAEKQWSIPQQRLQSIMIANGLDSKEPTTKYSEPAEFQLFTSLRYDPILLGSKENAKLSFQSNCPLYMSTLHRDRLLEAAHRFGFAKAEDALQDGVTFERGIMEAVGNYEAAQLKDGKEAGKPLKVKVIVHQDGDIQVELSPVPPVEMQTLYPTSLWMTSWPDVPDAQKSIAMPPLKKDMHTMAQSDSSAKAKEYLAGQEYIFVIDSKQTRQNAHTNVKTTWRPHYDAARQRNSLENIVQGEVLLQNTEGEITEGSITTPYFTKDGEWVTPPVHEGHGGQRGTTRRWALESGICAREAIITAKSIGKLERIWVSNGVRGFGWGRVMLIA